MKKTLIIILLSGLLTGCTAASLAKLLLPSASKGISVDAQIGDRNNTLGDQSSIGDVEGQNITIDQGNSEFEGRAEKVVINKSDYRLTFGALILGILIGWLCFKRPENMFKRAK